MNIGVCFDIEKITVYDSNTFLSVVLSMCYECDVGPLLPPRTIKNEN